MAAVVNTTRVQVKMLSNEDFSLNWPTNVVNGTIDFTGITSIKCQLILRQGSSNCPSQISFTGSAISMDSQGNLTMFLAASNFSSIDTAAIYAGDVLVKVPSLSNQAIVTHQIEVLVGQGISQFP